jgi:hypothetical protein
VQSLLLPPSLLVPPPSLPPPPELPPHAISPMANIMQIKTVLGVLEFIMITPPDFSNGSHQLLEDKRQESTSH